MLPLSLVHTPADVGHQTLELACERIFHDPWTMDLCFSDNFLSSNATLILKGMAPYGVVALEEIDRVCERLRVRQVLQAWHEEWRAVGAQLESRAYAALAKDHKITAGDLGVIRRGSASITTTPSASSHPARKSERRAKKPIIAGIPASACANRRSNSSRRPTRASRCRRYS